MRGRLVDRRCLAVCSSVLVVAGLFALCIFPFVFQYFINREFSLRPSSQSFGHWRRTPLPMTLDVYMFNWTNAQRSPSPDKPRFQEIGPYRFYETREKVNITWNLNGTVSYRLRRTWQFSGAESAGLSLDDTLTTVNGVALSAAFMVRAAPFFKKSSINVGFLFTRQRAWVSRTVGELLFDGYEDPLMTAAASATLASLSPVSSPFDKFGWFYKKNDSFTYDGWFTVEGRDMTSLGQLTRWNNRSHTGFYEGSCGAVRGYTGDMFPPGAVRPHSVLELFSHDLCRSLPFVYVGETAVEGLRALRFKAAFARPSDAALRMTDAEAPDNSCYCAGECAPSGFLNLTACRYGAPVFVSLPHFHGARERFYLDKVEGLRPDPDRHEFHIDIEPTYGIPVNVDARIQINMLMQKIPGISLYKSAPRLMVPVLWADQKVRITPPLAAELRAVVLLPHAVQAAGVASLCLALALALAAALLAARPAPTTDAEPPAGGHPLRADHGTTNTEPM